MTSTSDQCSTRRPAATPLWLCLCAAALLGASGCASMKTPAKVDVAVSSAAVDTAVEAGADQFAPLEMHAAREKMALAQQALAARKYQLADELASAAQADAKLAQGKANSAKAQAATDALQENIRVLREELNRNSQ